MRLRLETVIAAPAERCFDLSRSIDVHVDSMKPSVERAVDGVTAGLIAMDQEVEWRGRHFGLMLRHRSRITGFDRPRWFRDEMVDGHFHRFVHDHRFEEREGRTSMVDELEIESGVGPLDRLLLVPYLRRLLERRNHALRRIAEGPEWRRYLS